MKRHHRLLLLSALFCVSPTLAFGASPIYLTGSIANASTDLDVVADFERLIDDDDEGWSLGVGFHLGRFLAIEGAYHDYGTAIEPSSCTPDMLCIQVAPAQSDSTAVAVSVLPHWPLNDNVSIYGRFGVASWESDVSEAFSDLKLGSAEDEEAIYGAGVRLVFAGPFGAFAEVSRVGDTFETVSIGATWGF